MPIYEYQCPRCNKTEEKLLIGNEVDAIVWCFDCRRLCKRIISPGSGVVKGKYTAKTGYAYAAQNKPLGEMR